MIAVAVVTVLFAGDVMTTLGVETGNTVIEAEPVPNTFVQATVMPPDVSVTVLVVVLNDATPLTVQVVPAGIVVAPLMV